MNKSNLFVALVFYGVWWCGLFGQIHYRSKGVVGTDPQKLCAFKSSLIL